MPCACLLALLAAAMPAAAAPAAAPLTGVYYFPGWYRGGGEEAKPPYDRDSDWSEWRKCIARAATPRPLCGFYDDSDPRLWGYYTRWMASHGIDFIAFDWYYNDGQDYLYESLDRGFLQSSGADDVRFCIHWCNHGGAWWHRPLKQSRDALAEMIDRCCARYFHRGNYLRIGGRPVFMIYDIDELLSFGGVEGVKAGLAAMRERVRQRGFGDLYLVAVHSGTNADRLETLKALGFDAFTAYTYAFARPPGIRWDSKSVPYDALVDHVTGTVYPFLSRVARERGITYWPTTFSGWDHRPRAGLDGGFVLTGNTPERFGKLFRSALGYVDPASPVVMVEAWNEWGEGACIEPSKERGFGFLKEIAAARGKGPGDERLPPAEEILSWSVLDKAELEAARANEAKPWPVQETLRQPLGASYQAPEVKLPLVFDLREGGVPLDALSLNQLTVKGRTSEGLVLASTGSDPIVVLPEMKVPARQVRRITIEGEVLARPEAGTPVAMELHWQTALMPEFSVFASTSVPPLEGGRATLATSDVMAWGASGTPLTRIRLDPGSRAGVEVRLRRVVLAGE